LPLLTERQRHVLHSILAGEANKSIAYELGISEKTVETHRARVMQKFHVSSLAELVRCCVMAAPGLLRSGRP
jgi:two-component system response regulator FixJ